MRLQPVNTVYLNNYLACIGVLMTILKNTPETVQFRQHICGELRLLLNPFSRFASSTC